MGTNIVAWMDEGKGERVDTKQCVDGWLENVLDYPFFSFVDLCFALYFSLRFFLLLIDRIYIMYHLVGSIVYVKSSIHLMAHLC